MSLFSRMAVVTALALAACGSSSSGGGKDGGTGVDITTLVPTNTDVTGWTRTGNPSVLSAAQAGLGYESGGLDGTAAPFITYGLVQVALQDFAGANSATTTLRVWQMADAASELNVWNYLTDPANGTTYSGDNWSTVSIGEAGRIANMGNYYKLVVRKGVYQVEAMSPLSADAQAFGTAVVTKIP